MRRVLVGGPVRQSPDVLAAHLRTIQAQAVDAHISFAFIDDNDDAESRDLLEATGGTVLRAETPRDGAEYGVGEATHRWNIPAFHRLGHEKQRLLRYALEHGFDGIWLVDSDLLVGPSTLQSLIDTGAPIVSAVFWTRWTPEQPLMPQVWLQHPYGFDAGGWSTDSFFRALRARKLLRVRGLGACTYISREAIEAGASYEPLAGLPDSGMWQGEDRHFCVRAERLHIPMYADAWPEVWHCYRPSDRADLEAVEKHLSRPAPSRLRLTDWVSLAIEPLSNPRIAGHVEFVRGRLGLLELDPALVEAVRSMNAPDARFTKLSNEALVRVRLLDARRGRRPRA